MKILLIRHGEPDYEEDGLTEKGKREAAFLAGRIAPMQVKGDCRGNLVESGQKGGNLPLASGF